MDARKKLSKQGKHFALTIPEGQLISVKNLPNKQAYNKGQSNFWFDEQKKILHFREGQKKDKSIQLTYQNQQYQYEGVMSPNIYEVIVRTSIFSLLFGGTSPHVAVTEESLRLPFEQQPWFIGAVDKGELKAIELAETRMFFTRAKGPKIYLHWTTTSKMKTPRRAMLLESNDLSLVLPKDEFITARYNGGVILNHNEVLICRRVIENKLDEVKNIFEQGVNLASFVLREPNLISCYIESTPQESVNEELLLWLLEKGFPVDHDDTKFIDVATSKCSDIVVEALLERGIKCSGQAVSRAIKRDIPPHRMKIYFKALANTRYCHFEYYFDVINDYKDTEYTNRVLITLAWRHGNEDNLFKQLPKEIVQHIISYGVDDEYPWLEYIELFDLNRLRFISCNYRTLSNGELIKLAVIGWHYWQKLSERDIEFIYERILCNKPYQRGSEFYDNLSPWQMNQLVSWLVKLSTRHTLKQTKFTGSSFILYLLNNQNSAPIVKTLIQARVTPREWWLELTDLVFWSYPKAAPIPLSWHAVNPTKPHKALIELLIHEGLMPEQCLWYHRNTGLIAYLKRHGTTEDIEALSQFIEECRNKSKTSPLSKN